MIGLISHKGQIAQIGLIRHISLIRLKGYETEDTLEGRDEGGPDEGVQGLDR